MVVLIRPSFMKFCGDGCRVAAFSHIFYWIARKAKDQPRDKVRNGEITWYATTEEITADLAHVWGVCKVRKEVNALIDMGVIGQSRNQKWSADRTKHFFFGREECTKLLDLCQEHSICLLHIGLPSEILHLIDLTNANDRSIKCSCEDTESNDESIEYKRSIYQKQTIDLSNANDESIGAISQDFTQMTTKDSPKRECNVNPTATSVAALTPASPSNDQQTFEIVSVPKIAQEQGVSASQGPEEQAPVSSPGVAPPTPEDTGDKANDQGKRSSTTRKTGEKPKSSRRMSVPSSEALLLLDAWDQINGRSLTRTKEQVEAAEELARIQVTADDLRHVRDCLLAQKDGFWRARGVSLKNVASNFHVAALGPLPPPDGRRAKTSPPTQSATSPGEEHQPRKLLKRKPSAMQAERLSVGAPEEERKDL
jgi:hypothetical protein